MKAAKASLGLRGMRVSAILGCFLFLFSLLVCMPPVTCVAEWSRVSYLNTPVCTAVSNQLDISLIKSDGAYLVAWEDGRRVGYQDIYAQKLDSNGEALWTSNGLALVLGGEVVPGHTNAVDQSNPTLATNTSNGFFLQWQDDFAGIQYDCVWVNEFDGNGTGQWPSNGVMVQYENDGSAGTIIGDGLGGVFETHERDAFSLFYPRTDATRLNGSGALTNNYGSLSYDGSTTPPATYSALTYITPGAAIATWIDSGGANDCLRAQKLTAAGLGWPYAGVRLSLEPTSTLYIPANYRVVGDGASGVIAVWSDERAGSGDANIYAQRVNTDGSLWWSTGGVAICTVSNIQYRPVVTAVGDGGAVIAWEDSRADTIQVYAQRVDGGATNLWPAAGVQISSTRGAAPRIIRSSDGCSLILWADNDANGATIDSLRIQKVDDQGYGLWDADGVVVHDTTTATPAEYEMVSDGDGGAVVVWRDHRNGENIYAQRVFKNGSLDSNAVVKVTGEKMLPFAIRNQSYAERIGAVGGDGSQYSWTLTDGALPSGVTLDTATGVISGVPTNTGVYEFTLQAVAGTTNTKSFIMMVAIDTGVSDISATWPSVAKADDGTYLVIGMEGDTYRTLQGQFVNADGSLSGSRFDLATNNYLLYPAVAYDSTNDQYLVTYYQSDVNALCARTVAAGSATVGGEFVIQSGQNGYSALSYNAANGCVGLGYRLVNYPYTYYFAMLDGTNIVTNVAMAATGYGRPSLACNTAAGEWLMALETDSGIQGQFIAADGSFDGGLLTLNDDGDEPTLVYSALQNRYLLGVTDGTDSMGRFLDEEGAPDGDPLNLSADGVEQQVRATVGVSASGEFAAFWSDYRDLYGENSAALDIYGQTIHYPDGSALHADACLTPMAGTQDKCTVVEGPGTFDYFVTWSAGGRIYSLLWESPTADSDGDGMPDTWELMYGLNPTNSADAVTDADGDQLSNLQEYQLRSCPTNADTDNDDLSDYWEELYDGNPTNSTSRSGVLLTLLGALTNTALSAEDLWVADGRIYCAAGYLAVYDISDPTEMCLMVSNDMPSSVKGVWAQSNRVHMAAYSDYLVYDVIDPAHVEEVAQVATPYTALDVKVVSTNVYICDGTSLLVYDVSTPSTPVLMYSNTMDCAAVRVQDGMAYVAQGSYLGVSIFDLVDPVSPSYDAWFRPEEDQSCWRVDAVDAVMCAAAKDDGFYLADVSDPFNPQALSHTYTRRCDDVAMMTGLVFAADYYSGLQVYDVSDPATPRCVAVGSGGCASVSRVAVYSNLVAVAGPSGIFLYRVDVDSDGDGLGDAWEMMCFAGLGYDGEDDPDGDGINNWGEYEAGLNPTDDDEDSDGLIDGTEVSTHMTRPDVDDTDGDGATDGYEISNGMDPLDADMDNDGMPDGFEVQYGLSVNDSSDAAEDSDGDGLTNLQEYQNGTDPTQKDSDGDSMVDLWEITYGFNPTNAPGGLSGLDGILRGHWDTTGSVYGVSVYSNVAYLADYAEGLIAIDVSTAANPVMVGQFDTDGYAMDVCVENGMAYVSDSANGLVLVDVSEATNPMLSGHLDTSGNAYSTFICDTTAYVAAYGAGLYTIDISVPTNPVQVARYSDLDYVPDVHVVGDVASLAADYDGYVAVDISTATNPIVLTTYDVSGYCYGVFAETNRAFFANNWSGLYIINMDPPWNGSLLSHPTETGARDVMVLSNRAYVAEYTNGVEVFDVTSSTDPVLLCRYDSGGQAYRVDVVGDMMYIADRDNGLEIVELVVADTDGDGLLDSWERQYWGDLSQGATNDPDGDGLSNWGEYNAGLNPTNDDQDADGLIDGAEVDDYNCDPREEDTDNDTLDDAWEVANGLNPASNDTDNDNMPDPWEVQYSLQATNAADAAWDPDNDGLSNLQEYQNGTDPTLADSDGDSLIDGWEVAYGHDPLSSTGALSGVEFTWLGTLDTDGSALAVYVADGTAYIADYTNGLVVADVSVPTNPVAVGHYDTDEEAKGLDLVGDTLYLADDWDGLQIFDVTTATNPTLLGAYDTVGYAAGVQVISNVAYVADEWLGLQVIDVSTPGSCSWLGEYDSSGDFDNVYVVSNVAYVASEYYGLRAIDVSTPTNPVQQDVITTYDYAYDVEVHGQVAYVAADDYGLVTVDVSDPAAMVRLRYSYDADSLGINVEGQRAYLARSSYGLSVFDVPQATNIIDRGTFNTDGYAYDVMVVSNRAYVADGVNGMVIIDVLDRDADGDGLLDSWERQYWGDLSQGPTNDPDEDGLFNWGECQAGMSPISTDTDADGMPDAWEIQGLLQPTNAADADLDLDADGQSNYDEYVAGTEPNNAASLFAFDTVPQTEVSGLVVSWPSASNRFYTLSRTTNLVDTLFQDIVTDVEATPPLNVYTDTVSGIPCRVYRVKVRN